MKTRSKALYAYLLQSGVLHGTEDDIARAKREYRQNYKRQWKQQKRPRKEIRIEFTLKQFAAITRKAKEHEVKHTVYARNSILAAAGLKWSIPNKPQLLKILQLIGMAAIALDKNITPSWQLLEQLQQAEQQLLNYLKTE
jgi:hypothetical protein